MNYRHQFHAGNFADVVKHAVLVHLVRALQKKDKGLLYLDTHAGRGRYDLALGAKGDTLARRPEWPDGVGRLWGNEAVPPELREYLRLVADLNKAKEVPDSRLRFYPGSPLIFAGLARPQDRVALCEMQPEEFAALRRLFAGMPRVSVHETDGYVSLRAMLPPAERRALTLIDPPFEAQDEWAGVAKGLADGIRRLPGGVFAIWYPLTRRARADAFLDALAPMKPPPTLVVELTIAGENSQLKMRGCGLAIVNPPWRIEVAIKPTLEFLAGALAQAPGGTARIDWLVPDASADAGSSL